MAVSERRHAVEHRAGMSEGDISEALAGGGLDLHTADKLIENVVGTYALPLAVGVHLVLNGEPRVAPMVVEEPSVVAAASAACKIVAKSGGFFAEADEPVMIAQVQLDDVEEPAKARAALEAVRGDLMRMSDEAMPGMLARGGGMRGLEIRDLGDGMMVVHLLIDCRDAMGANIINTVAEAVGPRIARDRAGASRAADPLEPRGPPQGARALPHPGGRADVLSLDRPRGGGRDCARFAVCRGRSVSRFDPQQGDHERDRSGRDRHRQ
jgi:Hydroxymethylglutaryl-CoA reductase